MLRDDIVRFHRALGYVGARDSTAYVRFGMTEEAFVRSLPAALAAAVHGDCCDTEVVSAYITVPPRVVKVGGYERLYADCSISGTSCCRTSGGTPFGTAL